nr:hypothetical protein [Comamonas testosteroni]
MAFGNSLVVLYADADKQMAFYSLELTLGGFILGVLLQRKKPIFALPGFDFKE